MYLLLLRFFVCFIPTELFKWFRLKVFLKFLKKIVIIKPTQNSKPAKARRRNDVDISTTSSLITPTIVVYEYNSTHIISENNIIVNKLILFSKNINNVNQNKIIIKFIQFNNKNFKINQHNLNILQLNDS